MIIVCEFVLATEVFYNLNILFSSTQVWFKKLLYVSFIYIYIYMNTHLN